ncbi:F-box domain-containing protein [Caenorhabditis elegans]|uniref:F-box domain-containing protein n=1 Tax=Caenorhabditis elegans TaxID=6239 RepID=P91232_CAEEL|nr:F-box domain-containing protein [Caenorhabditis elegans]CCD69007.1 F-box domain-containing protein [Caenorhabditis elegans]|eukprot:NP_494358.1 SKN-1 Dependent Zygotic transcript [Caenorhabditis elegans]
MAARFPLLLRLPEKNLRIVLEQMGFLDLLAFSLCSKITKAHTTQLKRKIDNLKLHASIVVNISFRLTNQEEIRLDVKTDRFDRWNLNFCEIANVTYTVGYQQQFCWKKKGFGLRDWINHIMETFNYPVIDRLRLHGYMFPLANSRQISKVLNGLKVKNMDFWNYTEDGVFNIRSNLEIVALTLAFPDSEHFSELSTRRILSENQTNMIHHSMPFMAEMGVDRVLYSCITVNDLLVNNCTQLTISRSILTSKDMNIFLKHWINGSIKTLEFLELQTYVQTQWNMKILLKDIDHKIPCRVENGVPRGAKMFRIPRIDSSNLFMTYIVHDDRKYVLKIDARCG